MPPADRTLAERLARLHAGTGLNQDRFADLLGWGPSGQSRLSKILGGKQRPRPADIEAIAAAAGHPEQVPELLALGEDEQHQHRQFRSRGAAGHAPGQDDWYELLAATQVYRSIAPTYIPPLFHTPAYAAALMRHGADVIGIDLSDLPAAVMSRMRRKNHLLYEPVPDRVIEVVTTEAAFGLPPGPPPVMAAQLDELAGVLALGLPHVTFGVIPFGTELRLQPTTDFVLLDGRAYIETITGGQDKPGPGESAVYEGLFAELLAEAVVAYPDGRGRDDVLALIASWRARYDA